MTGHVRESLSAYLDRELPAGDEAQVEVHLRGCEACRRHLETLAAVDATARSLPVEAPAGYFDSLPGRVRARVEAAARPDPATRPAGAVRRWRSGHWAGAALPAWTWAVAAALLLGVVTPLTILSLRSPATPPATPREPAPFAAAPLSPDQGEGSSPADAPSSPAMRPPPPAPSEAPRRMADDFRLRDGDDRAAVERKKTAPTAGASAYARPAPVPAPAEPRKAEPEVAGFAAAPPVPRDEARPRAPGPGGPFPQQQGPAPGASRELAEAQAPPATGGRAEEMATPAGEISAAEDATLPMAAEEAKAAATPGRAGVQEGERSSRSRSDAALGRGRDEVEYQRLLAPGEETLDALRARREGWRAFASRFPQSRRADEARVQAVETGARIYRLTGDRGDKEQVEQDAAAYLARPDAVRAAAVREILAGLETSR